MNPVEIHINRTYRTAGGHDYFVQVMDSEPSCDFVEYLVMTGDKQGTAGRTTRDDFASRVVREVANHVLSLKGGL